MDDAPGEPPAMTDAAEINEEAETAMMEAAAAPAEESDGYEDSDDDAGHEPDSPNAVAAAALLVVGRRALRSVRQTQATPQATLV